MTEYTTLPISLKFTKSDKALVVGGGNIALQKIHWLQKFSIPIEVVAPEVIDKIASMAKEKSISLLLHRYTGLNHPYALVVAATSNQAVNRSVYKDATAQSIPVNVVDVPELCTFFVPSVVSRGRLQMTIASNGETPALCKRLRKEIEALVPPWYAQYVAALGHIRKQLSKQISDEKERADILTYFASNPMAEKWASVDEAKRASWLQQQLEQQVAPKSPGSLVGTVFLVGAGPGDKGLFTVKGLRSLVAADAVLYDGLVNPQILESLSPTVETFDTSKRAGCALRDQDDINGLMVRLAKEGKTVCRLKGGDPCVFGRVTEEARALARHNIPFQIVPGISSSIAALAYAGIPITDRECASYFQVVTGHEAPHKTESRVNWKDIANSEGTVVFLMGVHRIEQIAQRLLENGKSPKTPVAIISKGTLPNQQVYETTLANALSSPNSIPKMERPALIVVGNVVGLRKELNWFNPA